MTCAAYRCRERATLGRWCSEECRVAERARRQRVQYRTLKARALARKARRLEAEARAKETTT